MHDILFSISDYVGMAGVVLLLLAYFFLSTGRWISDSFIYQSLNFISAWLILFSLCFHWNLSSVIIEIAWVLISLMGIYRVWKKQQSKQADAKV